MSAPYPSPTDRQAERANQEIEQIFRCSRLGNETQHIGTKAAPFQLLYSFLPSEPIRQQLRIPIASALEILPLHSAINIQTAKRELARGQSYEKY